METHWPANLPQGVIHADLFPDNVFFLGDQLSGLIDFYFACNDALAYDVAVALNAWCFETDHSFNITKGQALLKGYQNVRADQPAEREVLPLLARGSALRFLLTRAYDWLHTAKEPSSTATTRWNTCAASSSTAACAGQRLRPGERHEPAMRGPSRTSVIYTDGACSGNPGPGGWGAILISGEHRKELSRRRGQTTNNRMELLAAISALEALKRPSHVDLHTDSKYVQDGIGKWIHGWKKAAGKPPTRSPSRTSSCGNGSTRPASVTR